MNEPQTPPRAEPASPNRNDEDDLLLSPLNPNPQGEPPLPEFHSNKIPSTGRISTLIATISALESLSFVLPFACFQSIQTLCKFSASDMLISLFFTFGFPTNWFTPHLSQYIYFKSPIALTLITRASSLLALLLMIISIATSCYYLFLVSRILQYIFLTIGKQISNNLTRASQMVWYRDSKVYDFFLYERSTNDIMVF
jgi:hypothetical protein